MALSPASLSSTCEPNGMAGDFLCLMKRRMPVLFETEEACAGLFHKGAEEYVVLSGTLGRTRGFLIIADKLLPVAQDRALFLAILDRLNKDSLSGLHQLLDHSGGVIYLYKQIICFPQGVSQELFDQLLEGGIREFRRGLRHICQELESVLTVVRRSGGSRMGTDRN